MYIEDLTLHRHVYHSGDYVNISVNLWNIYSSMLNYTLLVMVYDPDNSPLFATGIQGSLEPGKRGTHTFGFTLPWTAQEGAYRVEVMVMNDYPSRAGDDWELYAPPVGVGFYVVYP